MENEDIRLDAMFIASLVHDLIKAMLFIHTSPLGYHGNLKSSNCVVTSRWVLQVTDFGLHELRHSAENGSIGDHQLYRSMGCFLEKIKFYLYFLDMFWKAPELLKTPSASISGTQSGDVYAFAIILYEIIGRRGPFGTCRLEPKGNNKQTAFSDYKSYNNFFSSEIIDRVKSYPNFGEPFRPDLETLRESEAGCPDYVASCIEDCWAENPEHRPEFLTIRSRLKKMKDGM